MQSIYEGPLSMRFSLCEWAHRFPSYCFPVDYKRDIQVLLAAKGYFCHGAFEEGARP